MPFDLYIGPDKLKPALLAALLSVSLLIGLFAYLNIYTRRRYFNIWMVAWLFYAFWLTLTYRLQENPSPFLVMAKTWSVGISAIFLFWGSLIFMGRRVSQRLFGLLILFLLVWSYVGAYHVQNRLQASVPIFTMMGVASILAGRCFLVYRMRRTYAGATLLCAGFALWGAFLIGYPFIEGITEAGAATFVLAALLQLFIAVSMIILVLEEARMGRTVALNKMATERAARRGLETRVLSSEARFRTLFEQASDAIVITTRGDFTIIELNDRARRLLGLNDGVGGAKVSMESFRDRTVPLRTKDMQRLDRMPTGTALNLVSNDGRVNAVIMERTPVDVDGEPGYQFVFKELTERSQLEQQVRQAEKLSALGQMISGIAHELNNPLALIKGHLDLMLNRPDLPPAFRDDLSKVATESNRAAKLVRSFLSFAREQPPQRTAVDLNGLIQSVVELRKFDSLVAQTEIELALDTSLPQITADPDQVQQIMVNLINNALHAIVSTGAGGKIRVITEATDDHVRLRFEDNGPGVPVELRSRIFEPFFTTKETGAGTGLGLSISHSIMSEHGGKISCSSARLGGAAFILEFPRPAPADIPAPVLTDSPFIADHTGRVLVLDDEQALADMVGQMLSFYGHQVVVTSTPMQALEYIAREHFDAVISDYRMPLLDGREFHGEVRKINPDIASRIIFLTGDVLSEESRTFFGSIGNPRLTKPFQLETVARTVNDILMKRAA